MLICQRQTWAVKFPSGSIIYVATNHPATAIDLAIEAWDNSVKPNQIISVTISGTIYYDAEQVQ